ncbi:MAG: YibE/F family protein [Acidimicrobiia bacterium]|nr:YibE/F family protein [Acidimicrobiia bacterium]
MTNDDHESSLDDWVAFSADDDLHGGADGRTWRHPAVYLAIAIGVLVLIGLIVLRPTGEAREAAQASRSVIGLPTDFFDAEVTQVTESPCPFLPDEDCVTVVFTLEQGPDAGRAYTQVFTVGGTTPEFTEGTTAVLSYRRPNGRVVGVTSGPCEFDQQQTCLQVEVVATQGDVVGTTYVVEVAEGVGEYAPDQPVEITFDEDGVAIAVVPADISSQYQFADFERSNVLLVVFVIFAVAVIALGRWRGVAALAGLGATLIIVLVWLIPAILDGRNPVWVALIGASAVAYVALYVSHGFSLMTTVALLGTLAALALTTALSALSVWAARFTGLVSEESSLLTIFDGIDVAGLVLAGMVLGAAGALDDVTVTQSSAVWQLKRSNPDAGFGPLWRGGISIGQHHVGSTVNTLLLAYLGASLPLAVLFVLAQQSLGTIATSEVVAVEIVRTLVGSIGLVAAVPITTWLAARVASEGDSPTSAATSDSTG